VKARRLDLARFANADINRRAKYLASVRGEEFAAKSAADLVPWLHKLAASGAQDGTAAGDDTRVRTFGYAKQATILARFEPGSLRVLRIFFSGQDWRGHSR
jgi:hypothetical protein